MNYYIDTEFFEGFVNPLWGKRRHFIDLISIGIVSGDGREYYEISSDFEVARAWYNADTWVRDNVLLPIVFECSYKEHFIGTPSEGVYQSWADGVKEAPQWETFWYHRAVFYFKKYGKKNSVIASEIVLFVYRGAAVKTAEEWGKNVKFDFYGYYADYDWVLLCSLFGRMVDLPTGFPMFCRDLQQTKQELEDALDRPGTDIDYNLNEDSDYPQQTGQHNALQDARWNKQLHEFLLKYRERQKNN